MLSGDMVSGFMWDGKPGWFETRCTAQIIAWLCAWMHSAIGRGRCSASQARMRACASIFVSVLMCIPQHASTLLVAKRGQLT